MKSFAQETPPPAQPQQNCHGGGRPHQDLFAGRKGLANETKGAKLVRIKPMGSKNLARQRILQGAEPEPPRSIMPQNELYKAVAKAANAVVQNQ
jgi:hypothetical protein